MIRAIVCVAVFLLHLFSAPAVSRELREDSLSDKVRYSDLVAIGKATGIQQEDDNPLIRRWASIDILAAYKGGADYPVVKMVTAGPIEEMNPACCEVGSTYLLFLQNGVSVLEDDSGEFVMVRKLEGQYFAGANGPYSAYRIRPSEGQAFELHPGVLRSAKDRRLARGIGRFVKEYLSRARESAVGAEAVGAEAGVVETGVGMLFSPMEAVENADTLNLP
jgi:hypothetical protein